MLHSLYIINKAGGLIYQKDYTDGVSKLSSNEYLVLAGTFHSVHVITSKISPLKGPSGGLEVLETDLFKMFCVQSPTGTKFLLFTDPATNTVEPLMKRIYEVYADYVMKNPFYTPEMPIRAELFDLNLGRIVKLVNGGAASALYGTKGPIPVPSLHSSRPVAVAKVDSGLRPKQSNNSAVVPASKPPSATYLKPIPGYHSSKAIANISSGEKETVPSSRAEYVQPTKSDKQAQQQHVLIAKSVSSASTSASTSTSTMRPLARKPASSASILAKNPPAVLMKPLSIPTTTTTTTTTTTAMSHTKRAPSSVVTKAYSTGSTNTICKPSLKKSGSYLAGSASRIAGSRLAKTDTKALTTVVDCTSTQAEPIHQTMDNLALSAETTPTSLLQPFQTLQEQLDDVLQVDALEETTAEDVEAAFEDMMAVDKDQAYIVENVPKLDGCGEGVGGNMVMDGEAGVTDAYMVTQVALTEKEVDRAIEELPVEMVEATVVVRPPKNHPSKDYTNQLRLEPAVVAPSAESTTADCVSTKPLRRSRRGAKPPVAAEVEADAESSLASRTRSSARANAMAALTVSVEPPSQQQTARKRTRNEETQEPAPTDSAPTLPAAVDSTNTLDLSEPPKVRTRGRRPGSLNMNTLLKMSADQLEAAYSINPSNTLNPPPQPSKKRKIGGDGNESSDNEDDGNVNNKLTEIVRSEKKYKCVVEGCGRAYKSLTGLLNHRLKVHGTDGNGAAQQQPLIQPPQIQPPQIQQPLIQQPQIQQQQIQQTHQQQQQQVQVQQQLQGGLGQGMNIGFPQQPQPPVGQVGVQQNMFNAYAQPQPQQQDLLNASNNANLSNGSLGGFGTLAGVDGSNNGVLSMGNMMQSLGVPHLQGVSTSSFATGGFVLNMPTQVQVTPSTVSNLSKDAIDPTANASKFTRQSGAVLDGLDAVKVVAGDAKPFHCTVPGCDKKYRSSNGLAYHLEKGHAGIPLPIVEPNGNDPPKPPKKIRMTKKRRERLLRKEAKKAEKLAAKQALLAETNGKPYVCPHEGCGRAYKNKNGLLYHQEKSKLTGHASTAEAREQANRVARIPPPASFRELVERLLTA
ncbi:hypothetical protein HDV05_000500 [Chytridiales sp. JEL 0842]|nr:hypothetical protein HDV05_000500 [Chytridiales sp. JEL 0842]